MLTVHLAEVLGDRKGSEPASALQDRRRPALRDSKMTDGHICPRISHSPWWQLRGQWFSTLAERYNYLGSSSDGFI